MHPDRRERPAAAKDWCFTINNPEEGMEVEFRRLLDLHCQYWVYGREVGAQSTPHLQGFAQFKVKCRLETAKNYLAVRGAHMEKSRGTAQETADYCKIDGDNEQGGLLQAAGKSGGLQLAVDNIQNNGRYSILLSVSLPHPP